MVKVIFSYHQGSGGARELAQRMGIRRLRHENSKWTGGPGKELINWGSSTIPRVFTDGGTKVYNNPAFVGRMSNKLDAFRTFQASDVSPRHPTFTTELTQAQRWLANGNTVMARTQLNGHSGAGIVIMDPDHPDNHNTRANLYTMYVPKQSEYRVHVVKSGDNNYRPFLVQKKGLRNEFKGQDDVNWKVRNLANGFVYVRNTDPAPQDVIEQAVLALRASQLDFGAVDVIYNNKQGAAYVLEINTAPGLVGTTVDDYARELAAI